MTTEPARIPEPLLVEAHAARIERQDDVPVLALPPDGPFERLREAVQDMLSEDGSHAHLRGQTVRLDLGARDIVLFDLRRLTTLLAEEADVHVGGLSCSPAALHRYAEKQLKMRVHVEDVAELAVSAEAPADPCVDLPEDEREVAPEAAPPAEAGADEGPADDGAPQVATAAEDAADDGSVADETIELDATAEPDAGPSPSEDEGPALSVVHTDPARPAAPAALPEGGRRTVSVHRSLRSGAIVRFPGDIVVFGDVNPGAELVADGDIVVLGALRGSAHAGAHGDESATVMAFSLKPTILRIAQRQATDLEFDAPARGGLLSLLRAPGLADRGAPRAATPRVARVVDGAVVVSDYAARAPR